MSRSVAGAPSATGGNTPREVTGRSMPRGAPSESREQDQCQGSRRRERRLRRTRESGPSQRSGR
eukprot:10287241-Alexandrium_andersonii.AAC.1